MATDQVDAAFAIGQRRVAGHIGPDEVPLDLVALATHVDAVLGVARDQVARTRAPATEGHAFGATDETVGRWSPSSMPTRFGTALVPVWSVPILLPSIDTLIVG